MKKVIPLFSLFTLIVFAALPAFACHWVLIGEGNYVDADSIRPTSQANYYTGEGSGNVYTLWTKFVASEEPIERMYGKDVWSSRAKVVIDCGNKTATRLSYYAYDGEGYAIAEYPKVNEKFLNIKEAADTPASEIFNFVCTDEFVQHVQHRHHTQKYGD